MSQDPNHLNPFEQEAYERALADWQEAVAREPYQLMVIPGPPPLQKAQEDLEAAVRTYLEAAPPQSLEEAVDPAVKAIFANVGEARAARVLTRPDGVIDVHVVVSLFTPVDYVTVKIDTEEG